MKFRNPGSLRILRTAIGSVGDIKAPKVMPQLTEHLFQMRLINKGCCSQQ